METFVRHALLREDRAWECTRSGLDLAAAGSLALVRVPAPHAGGAIRLDGPFDADPSGIEVDGCARLFRTDTTANRLIMDVTDCGFRYVLPPDVHGSARGPFRAPAGLAMAGDTLYVADSANARVVGFLVPALEARRVLDAGLQRPTGLAADDEGRLYVLDRGRNAVLRFRADGTPDTAYNTAMAAHAELASPAFLALGADDVLYVSEEQANRVLAFDCDGQLAGTLSIPVQVPAVRPRALAAQGNRIYAADAARGIVLAFGAESRACLGNVPDFRGPVAAMACDGQGNLLIKPGAGEDHHVLRADAGCIARGMLETGPLDAGIKGDWERIAADVDVPAGTRMSLRAYASSTATPAPSEAYWSSEQSLAPSLDTLLARDPGPASGTQGARRFLWLRATMESGDGRRSPTLFQVRAQTTGASYLEQLPRFYSRDDAPSRFLERLLALSRSELEDWNEALDGLARRFDPATAPADGLPWLARWLAFAPPRGLDPASVRKLLARVPELYARRGTLSGLRDFAEIYAGVRPHILEAFQSRRVWQLDTSSRLGFDTALAAAAADGLVLPGPVRTDPAYAGLQGDYYAGLEFERRVMRRTDSAIVFGSGNPLNVEEAGQPVTVFSVRWSGQIRPRFDETYTFHVQPGTGVRLWIDGLPVIESWKDRAAAVGPARTAYPLRAGRWYSIVFEVRRDASQAGAFAAVLEWSSRSQRREPIPADCLYSVLDERADLSASAECMVDVGNAVVGESGPQPASDYGTMLFAEHAHLFTVVTPAGRCCDEHRRKALREVIDAEKPAHTDYHLCFAEPRMRVGFQARLGIDAIVANGPPPLRLDETALGRNSYLADAAPGGGRIAARARLGQDTIVG